MNNEVQGSFKMGYLILIWSIGLFAIGSWFTTGLMSLAAFLALIGCLFIWRHINNGPRLFVASILLFIYSLFRFSGFMNWVFFEWYTWLELIVGPIVCSYFVFECLQALKERCTNEKKKIYLQVDQSSIYTSILIILILQPFALTLNYSFVFIFIGISRLIVIYIALKLIDLIRELVLVESIRF